jgi:release factor glutamine methyltransferase
MVGWLMVISGLWCGPARHTRPVRIITVPGVFAPRSDAWMLADVLTAQARLQGADVLELGTGSGAIAIAAARGGARSVVAVDISRRALACAWLNARLNGARVQPRHGDLFGPVRDERFDFVVSNPPYLPSPDARPASPLPTRGAARAWEGGSDGRSVLERICAQVGYHLRPGGTVLLMQSSVNGLGRTLDALEAAGLHADVVARRRGPLGPLLSARASALRAHGLIGPRDEEELYVVRGRRP